MSLREAITSADPVKTVPVEVPEWGGTFYVKKLGFGDKVALVDALTDPSAKDRLLYVVALLHCVFDQDGNRAFGLDEYDVVNARDPDAVLRLGRMAAALNKLVDVDVIEDAKKN